MKHLPRLKKIAILMLFVNTVDKTLCAAQGKPEDYARSAALAQTVRGKVSHSVVQPNWLPDGKFWFRSDLGGGLSEYIVVDPTKPSKEPAFDHAKLATSLSIAKGISISPTALNLDRISFTPGAADMLILNAGQTYTVDLTSYAVHISDTKLPPVTTPQAGRRRPAAGSDVPPREFNNPTSPDGKWSASIKKNNVVIKETATGTETPFTTDGTVEDRYEGGFHWSPASSRLVVMKVIPAQEHKVYLVESSPKDQVQPKLTTLDYLKPGDNIAHPRPHMFSIADKKEITIKEDLFPNPWEISGVAWSGSNEGFTFQYNQRGHQAYRLIRVDADTGEATALIDETVKTFVDWTNKVYLRKILPTNEAIWMSERDGWNHLYLYDLKSGKVKNQVTKGNWVVRSVTRVDEPARQIWFQAGGIIPGQDPYYLQLCRVNFDGSGLTILTEGDGNHSAAISPDGKFLLDTYSRVDMPPVTTLRRMSDGSKVLDLEKADATKLIATGWSYPERFVSKARDGKTEIYGVIVRPTNFDPKKHYPVIENIYAGPQGAFVPKSFSANSGMQGLAELGFIVVQVDGLGTNYRSKAFHDVCWQNLGDAGFPDRLIWIKAAAAHEPAMDLSRVGIYGTSAGGQNALGGILQYPEFYKVCVSDCGCHDNRMDKIWWNEQWMGYPIGPHYDVQSNVTLAPKLRGKLLLMVGEMDNNVDPASTMQVVNSLVKANKEFDYFVMPGQGHGVAGSPYGRRKLQDFFVRNLLGVEPPNRNAQ